jgi:NAD(P)H-dependent flavin oxidoreductase YrpB (nitropropane dioxygenase family)
MTNRVCALTGAEFPLFAFSHCRDVVVEVSRAGGFGVLGGSTYTPESLEMELDWIDRHVNGRPYGVDILFPEIKSDGGDPAALIPEQHWEFMTSLLGEHGVSFDRSALPPRRPAHMHDVREALMDVAFRHPIRLIASALGVAPPSMIKRAKEQGVVAAALVGAASHAVKQVEAGVDLLIAQGTEAGGHCGEISTLVLVPEVVRAVKRIRDVPVLAAGGIMTGQQMAGAMAMGAEGAWTGSVWLATRESETTESFRQKMIAASSRDTVRSPYRTGKLSRQLRSAWHDAWEGPDSPGPLPMPQMGIVSGPAFREIDRAAEAGNAGAQELLSYWVGQGVGLVDSVRSAADVVQSFMGEYGEAVEHLNKQLQ